MISKPGLACSGRELLRRQNVVSEDSYGRSLLKQWTTTLTNLNDNSMIKTLVRAVLAAKRCESYATVCSSRQHLSSL
jgi:hypothetical protein